MSESKATFDDEEFEEVSKKDIEDLKLQAEKIREVYRYLQNTKKLNDSQAYSFTLKNLKDAFDGMKHMQHFYDGMIN